MAEDYTYKPISGVQPMGSSSVKAIDDSQDRTPDERRASMNWAQRLKRVFDIDVETCAQCGGGVKVTAPAHPAPVELVHPCTSSPVLKTLW